MRAHLNYGGVVFHEMSGEYGEPSTYLEAAKQQILFSDTCYQYDAGGKPKEIVTLSYEEFLAFYEHHYQGSNAYITLYGNLNTLEMLKYLNENGLANVIEGDYKANMPMIQQRPQAPTKAIIPYPASREEGKQAILSMSFVIDHPLDQKLRLGFELLEHMLLRSAASPLLEALVLKHQVGVSLSDGGYDSYRQQPVFTITLKGCKQEDVEHFEQIVFETLENLVNNKISKALIDASLNTLSFELKEVDASYEPIGIQYSEMILNSYLRGGKAFEPLCYSKYLDAIYKDKDNGYFEDLIKHYLLENVHYSVISLVPDQALSRNEIKQKKQHLSKKKAHLSKEDKKLLIKQTCQFEAEPVEQMTADILPSLTKEDLPEQIEALVFESLDIDGCPAYFHEADTKEIIYIQFLWETSNIAEVDLGYVGLFAHLFSYLGTKQKTFAEIENEINTITGGINSSLRLYERHASAELLPIFKVNCKVERQQLIPWLALMEGLFKETIFTEKAKIKEALGHMLYEIERSFEGAPEYRATSRVYSYFKRGGVYEDRVAGLAYYKEMKQIYDTFEESFEILTAKLTQVYQGIMQKGNLRLCMTTQRKCLGPLLKGLEQLVSHLEGGEVATQPYELPFIKKNEAFTIDQDVQAISQGFDFMKEGFKYHGSLEVLANILESTYLWENIRLQGGAYGCDLLISQEGYLAITSYCDPNLLETLEVYKGISQFIKTLQLEEGELERYIISTLGTMLSPVSMEQRSERACYYFITGIDPNRRPALYQEIKSTTLQTLRSYYELFEQMNRTPMYCVVGNKEKVEACKKHFDVIHFSV